MAQLARNYYKTLQQSDPVINLNPEENDRQLESILDEIPNNQKIETPDETALNWPITQNQVLRALHLMKNAMATGLDGCPYELWKTLKDQYDAATRTNQNAFDIVKVLTAVFNDICLYGVDPRTGFAQGWMCPIYKKKRPH